MAITTVQALTTKTAPFNGASVNISGITGDWMLKLRVAKLTAGKKCRFVFADSVNAFTNELAGPAYSVEGEIAKEADRVFSVRKQDFPSLRFGVANAVLRLELTEVDSGGSVDYEAWLES